MADHMHILRNPHGHSADEVRAARLWAGDEIERLSAEVARLQQELEVARRDGELKDAALKRSIVALDDWLHLDFPDHCESWRVEESQMRIDKRGTVAYIAELQEANRAAIDAAREG